MSSKRFKISVRWINGHRKLAAISSLFKRALAAFVLLTLNWTAFTAAYQTVAYLVDTESSAGNLFSAGILQLTTPASNDFSPTVSPLYPVSSKNIALKNDGNMPFAYQIKIDEVSGTLCSSLTLKANFGAIEKYNGPITEDQLLISGTLPELASGAQDSWAFAATMGSADPTLMNTKCDFKFVVSATQIGGGFSDSKTVSNTVNSSSWDASTWAQTTTVDFGAGTLNKTVITDTGDGEIQLGSVASGNFGITSAGSTNYPTGTINVGNINTGTQVNSHDYLIWESYTTSVPITVNKIYTYGTVGGYVKVAIYSDNAGNPGTKLTTEVSDSATANSWNQINITATYLPAGKYWVVFAVPSDNIITASSPANGSRRGKSFDFHSTFPNNPASSGTILSIGDRSDCVYFAGAGPQPQQGYIKTTKATLAADNVNITSANFYSHTAGNGRLAIYGDNTFPLSGWNRRKSHTILGASGAGSDYQVRMIVHKGTGTDSGDDVYLGNNVRDDFGDVRFTSGDGTTLLSYWMETGSLVNGSQTAFWVKVNDDLGSNRSIYVYYGNTGATTTSNGINTFVMFDDFDGSSLDGSKWTRFGGNVPSFSGGQMTVSANNIDPSKIIATGAPQDNNLAIGSRFKETSGTNDDERIGLGAKTNLTNGQGYNYVLHSVRTGIFSTSRTIDFLDDTVMWGNQFDSWSKNIFYTIEVFHNGSSVRGRTNFGTWNNQSWNGRNGYLALNIGSKDAVTTWDWVFVRKCITNEPTHGSWGTEESGGGPGTKLWESVDTAMTAGWNTVNISGLQLDAGTYWLAWQWNSASAGPSYTPGNSGDGYYLAQSYGAFPGTWSGGSASGERWSMYLTYSNYEPSGTFESAYFDNAKINYWDSLEWDEAVIPGVTDITFEVGVANTNPTLLASWTWTTLSGESPTTLALPETRYIKWRATLTTADTGQTPVLYAVRVKYYAGAATEHIVLNEFLPNPDPSANGLNLGDDASQMPYGEWVELYNKDGGKPVDLAGWQIKNAAGNAVAISSSNTLGGSTIINPGSWLVVYLNQAMLDNAGDTVSLYDVSEPAMLVDSYTYSFSDYCTPDGACPAEVPANKSYARIPDGIGIWVDPIPTPGQPNELEEGKILINGEVVDLAASTCPVDNPAADTDTETVAGEDFQPAQNDTSLVIQENAVTTENATSTIETALLPADNSETISIPVDESAAVADSTEQGDAPVAETPAETTDAVIETESGGLSLPASTNTDIETDAAPVGTDTIDNETLAESVDTQTSAEPQNETSSASDGQALEPAALAEENSTGPDNAITNDGAGTDSNDPANETAVTDAAVTDTSAETTETESAPSETPI